MLEARDQGRQPVNGSPAGTLSQVSLRDKIIANAQPLLNPGEQVQAVVPGQQLNGYVMLLVVAPLLVSFAVKGTQGALLPLLSLVLLSVVMSSTGCASSSLPTSASPCSMAAACSSHVRRR